MSVLPRMARAARPPAAGAAPAAAVRVRRRRWDLGRLALGAAAVRLLLGTPGGTAGRRAG
jgi:hypothetical protein